jgi:hypothetical protein
MKLAHYVDSFMLLRLLLLAAALGLGLTWGTRRAKLTITQHHDLPSLRQAIETMLLDTDRQIFMKGDVVTRIYPRNKWFRLLNNWFHTESIHIICKENELHLAGPNRVVEVLDSKLRFGKLTS